MNTRIVVLLIITWLAASPLTAQFVVPFTAQEGYTAAAKLPTNITDLTFHSALTFHADATIIKLGMNLNTGKSEAWAYLFKAKSAGGKDTTFLYLMTKTILGTFTPVPIPSDISLPDSLLLMPAITGTWLNSDKIAQKLNEDALVKEYRKKNPDSLYAQSVGLLKTPLGEAQWIATFTDEDTAPLTCIVDAASGVVLCAGLPTPVNESIYASLQQGSVWPLPARDMVFLQLAPALYSHNASLELFDAKGVAVRSFSHQLPSQVDAPLPLSVEGLANGFYLLQYRSQDKVATFPVVISR